MSVRSCFYSLFEEQLRREAEQNAASGRGRHRELRRVVVLLPDTAADEDHGPRQLPELARTRGRARSTVPVIGSLNGSTPGSWARYARAMQDSGAAAIELNIYYLPGDPHISRPRRRTASPRHPWRGSRKR